MSVFDPASILNRLVSSLGIEPEQLRATLALIISEVQTIRAEREAFKIGSAAVVAEFRARLDRLEANSAAILALIETRAAPAEPPIAAIPYMNGGPPHE